MFNHDLGQIFIGASDAPRSRLSRHCEQEATSLVDWQRSQRIEWMEAVEEFPEKDHAVAYANWLYREGAFEGVEDYSIGLDDTLRASRNRSRAS